MGIGVADPIDGMTVGAVLDQLEIGHDRPLDQPVFLGGPVEPSRGFVLHSLDWGGHEAVQVGDRWMVSSSHDILRAIAEGRGKAQADTLRATRTRTMARRLRADDTEEQVAGVELRIGDRVVVVAGSPPNTVGSTNLMRVHEVGTDS